MTGFDIVDRHDIAMWLVLGVVMVGTLALGAPLWAAVVIMFAGCTAGSSVTSTRSCGRKPIQNPTHKALPGA